MDARMLWPLLCLGLMAQTPDPTPPTAIRTSPFPTEPPAPKVRGGKPFTETLVPSGHTEIARIGGRVIRESDFQNYLSIRFQPQQLAQLKTMSDAKRQLRQEYLESLLLAAKAKKMGLDQTPAYTSTLDVLEMQALLKALMQQESPVLASQSGVGDGEVEQYYREHQAAFKSPDTFSVRHILVKVKGGSNGSQGLPEEAARERALQAKAALLHGASWNEVASTYSDDARTRNSGGLYENMHYGEFTKAFDDAVKAQPIGTPGDPVRSPWGFHILVVESRTPGTTPPLEQIKDVVKQQAMARKKAQAWATYLTALKQEIGFSEPPTTPPQPPVLEAPPTKPGS